MKAGAVVLCAALFGAQVALAGLRQTAVDESLFEVYATNRAAGIPNYVTADMLLLGYSLVRARSERDLERSFALPALESLLAGLADALSALPEDDVQRANRDYLVVLRALVSGLDEPQDAADAARAAAELALVRAAGAPARSPLWQTEIDYGQFRPRGPYADDPTLARYFRASRYASGVLFHFRPSRATAVSAALADRMAAQALQLVRILTADARLAVLYTTLTAQQDWSVGPADDLVVTDLAHHAEALTQGAGIAELRARVLQDAAAASGEPRIVGGIVHADALEDGVSPRAALVGWRLLPSRYTPESAAFQAIVYEAVGEHTATCDGCAKPFGLGMIGGRPVKAYPSVYELLAMLGSQAAQQVVETQGEGAFVGYAEARAEAEAELTQADGLAGLRLRLMHAWFDEEPPSEAEAARRASSLGAFWAWQRYLDVLYAKQSYTTVGKSLVVEPQRAGASLEPAAALYRALREMAVQHAIRAAQIGPGATVAVTNWHGLTTILDQCIRIAEIESAGQGLTVADEDFLNGLDREIEALAGRTDSPIVVDIHTSPATGQVVQMGTLLPRIVRHAAAGPHDARGAVLAFEEFKRPIDARMTTEEWLAELQARLARALEPQHR